MSENEEMQKDEREALQSIYEGDESFKEQNPTTFQYKAIHQGNPATSNELADLERIVSSNGVSNLSIADIKKYITIKGPGNMTFGRAYYMFNRAQDSTERLGKVDPSSLSESDKNFLKKAQETLANKEFVCYIKRQKEARGAIYHLSSKSTERQPTEAKMRYLLADQKETLEDILQKTAGDVFPTDNNLNRETMILIYKNTLRRVKYLDNKFQNMKFFNEVLSERDVVLYEWLHSFMEGDRTRSQKRISIFKFYNPSNDAYKEIEQDVSAKDIVNKLTYYFDGLKTKKNKEFPTSDEMLQWEDITDWRLNRKYFMNAMIKKIHAKKDKDNGLERTSKDIATEHWAKMTIWMFGKLRKERCDIFPEFKFEGEGGRDNKSYTADFRKEHRKKVKNNSSDSGNPDSNIKGAIKRQATFEVSQQNKDKVYALNTAATFGCPPKRIQNQTGMEISWNPNLQEPPDPPNDKRHFNGFQAFRFKEEYPPMDSNTNQQVSYLNLQEPLGKLNTKRGFNDYQGPSFNHKCPPMNSTTKPQAFYPNLQESRGQPNQRRGFNDIQRFMDANTRSQASYPILQGSCDQQSEKRGLDDFRGPSFNHEYPPTDSTKISKTFSNLLSERRGVNDFQRRRITNTYPPTNSTKRSPTFSNLQNPRPLSERRGVINDFQRRRINGKYPPTESNVRSHWNLQETCRQSKSQTLYTNNQGRIQWRKSNPQSKFGDQVSDIKANKNNVPMNKRRDIFNHQRSHYNDDYSQMDSNFQSQGDRVRYTPQSQKQWNKNLQKLHNQRFGSSDGSDIFQQTSSFPRNPRQLKGNQLKQYPIPSENKRNVKASNRRNNF